MVRIDSAALCTPRRRELNAAMAQEVTDATFEQEVLKHEGVVLVDFWAPWCAPCRRLAPIIDELAETYAGRAKILKCNVDENPVTPGKYGIQGIPTLLLFKDGELLDTMVGAAPKEVLTQKLDSAL